jgi:hypothetical protein
MQPLESQGQAQANSVELLSLASILISSISAHSWPDFTTHNKLLAVLP